MTSAAAVCESASETIAAPSYCPNIQQYDSRPPPTDSASCRTTASGKVTSLTRPG